MRREDIDKLLGGWAAGTLTDAERSALLQAALDDQALFDQLIQEEPLRETLADPVLRGRVARALDASEPRRAGWFSRPWAWGLAGSVAASAIMIVALVQWNRAVRPETKAAAVQMARTERPQQPAPDTAPQTPPPPAPAARETKARQLKDAPLVRSFEARDATAPTKAKADAPALVTTERPRADAADKRKAIAELPAAPSQAADRAQMSEPPALAASQRETVHAEAQRMVAGGAAGMAAQSAPPPAPPAPAPAAAPQSAAFMRQPVVATESARALFERGEPGRTKGAARPGPRRTGTTYVMVPPPVNSLGLRYRILRRAPGGDWAEADPDRTFRADDALRLEVSVNERAYYYTIVNDAVLASGIASQTETQSIPILRGTTRITLIASREPLAAPLEARRRGSESLVEKSGGAVYVAKTSFMAESQVTAEVVLRYEQ